MSGNEKKSVNYQNMKCEAGGGHNNIFQKMKKIS